MHRSKAAPPLLRLASNMFGIAGHCTLVAFWKKEVALYFLVCDCRSSHFIFSYILKHLSNITDHFTYNLKFKHTNSCWGSSLYLIRVILERRSLKCLCFAKIKEPTVKNKWFCFTSQILTFLSYVMVAYLWVLSNTTSFSYILSTEATTTDCCRTNTCKELQLEDRNKRAIKQIIWRDESSLLMYVLQPHHGQRQAAGNLLTCRIFLLIVTIFNTCQSLRTA